MKSPPPFDLRTATDAELIQLCKNGDQNAYGQIVERYQTLICSVVYNRCGDLALSEDLAQDGFILAWQKLDDLKDVSKFKAWICTIVRNLVNRSSQRSSRSVTQTAVGLDAVADLPSDNKSPVERAVSAEEEKLVWQALADVPENYREPLILFYREEQSVTRVAEALGLSEDTVKQRLSRGRKMLRQHLAAVVESALVHSKPKQAFTGAVLLALSGATAKSAAAAGVTTAAANVTKSVTVVGAGSGLGSLWLGPILKLPLVAWLFKTAWDETRLERERRLMRSFLSWGVGGFVAYAVLLVSSLWWGEYVLPLRLQPFLPAAMMIAFLIPWIVLSRRLGKRMELLRAEEGTSTPLRPLVESGNAFKAYGIYCLSSLLVMAGPAILPVLARDWIVLSAMIASAIFLGCVAAQLSLLLPKWSFQLFSLSAGLTVIVTLGIMVWRQSVWGSAFADFLPWFIGTTSCQTMILVLLTTIAWKRGYGKLDLPDERR
ncbi:RNA polymerase sigma factor [Bremerella sp.]|uniref:RNA polymerase sigma factor n=1 Tax=Bremerella sp. TaxID=2795602 RepID=UPI00391D9B56